MSETKSLDYFLELTKGQNLQKKKGGGLGEMMKWIEAGNLYMDMRITWQESGK